MKYATISGLHQSIRLAVRIIIADYFVSSKCAPVAVAFFSFSRHQNQNVDFCSLQPFLHLSAIISYCNCEIGRHHNGLFDPSIRLMLVFVGVSAFVCQCLSIERHRKIAFTQFIGTYNNRYGVNRCCAVGDAAVSAVFNATINTTTTTSSTIDRPSGIHCARSFQMTEWYLLFVLFKFNFIMIRIDCVVSWQS